MTIYQLKRFIEKQREELLDYLKPVRLSLSQASFTQKWREEEKDKKVLAYYDVKDMISLEINVQLYKLGDKDGEG